MAEPSRTIPGTVRQQLTDLRTWIAAVAVVVLGIVAVLGPMWAPMDRAVAFALGALSMTIVEAVAP
jgi:hypothetical protein